MLKHVGGSMKITLPGRDIITINENDIDDCNQVFINKIHLIRLCFNDPTVDKMEWVIKKFNTTNRYVVDIDNLRFYNYFLKRTNLKYYVINTNDTWRGLVSFYKRNNKVLLDITQLSEFEKQFVLNINLKDILFNTEVIMIDETDYSNHYDVINSWNGNCIIKDDDYLI